MSCSDTKHILFEFNDSKDDKVVMFAIIVYELKQTKNGALPYSIVLKQCNFRRMKQEDAQSLDKHSCHSRDITKSSLVVQF